MHLRNLYSLISVVFLTACATPASTSDEISRSTRVKESTPTLMTECINLGLVTCSKGENFMSYDANVKDCLIEMKLDALSRGASNIVISSPAPRGGECNNCVTTAGTAFSCDLGRAAKKKKYAQQQAQAKAEAKAKTVPAKKRCRGIACKAASATEFEPNSTTLEYDEFEQYWSVTLDMQIPNKTSHFLRMRTLVGSKQRKKPPTKEIAFALVSSSSGWRYLKCHTFRYLVEDEPERPESKHHGDSIGGGNVLEYVSIPITPKGLKEIQNSKETRMRVCNTEFTITPIQKMYIADFLSELDYIQANKEPRPHNETPATAAPSESPAK